MLGEDDDLAGIARIVDRQGVVVEDGAQFGPLAVGPRVSDSSSEFGQVIEDGDLCFEFGDGARGRCCVDDVFLQFLEFVSGEVFDVVDGLVVEGSEGGGFKNPSDVSTMVLLPLVASKVKVPVIAAGGFVDGRTMAAALALGAEAIQMGTRMVATLESPIHDNWKQAIVAASETDTVLLNRHAAPSLRVLRTDRSNALEFDTSTNAMEHMARHTELYFGGDMDAALALGGAVAGRIESIEPVADVIKNCANECLEVLRDLGSTYVK